MKSSAIPHTPGAILSPALNHILPMQTTRMSGTPSTRAELLRLLDTAPPEARAFLNSRTEDGRLVFSIEEAILVARA